MNFTVRDSAGNIVEGLIILTTRCLQCGQEVDGYSVALPAPYFGMLHYRCAPFFGYDGQYPHPNPVVAYHQNSKP